MHNKVLFIQNFMCMHVYMHVYIRRRLFSSSGLAANTHPLSHLHKK